MVAASNLLLRAPPLSVGSASVGWQWCPTIARPLIICLLLCPASDLSCRFRKRGLAVVPVKFGISFTTKFLNQAGALVHVYTGKWVARRRVDVGDGAPAPRLLALCTYATCDSP